MHQYCTVILPIYFTSICTDIVMLLPEKFQEAENIIYRCLHDEAELDTVVYNTFIKSMLESGLDNVFLLGREENISDHMVL